MFLWTQQRSRTAQNDMLQLPQHGLSECTAVGGSTTWRFPRQILYLWPCIWFLHSRMGRRSHQDMIPWYSAECSNLERLHSRSHQWRLLSGKSIKHCLWIGLDLGFCCKLSRFHVLRPVFEFGVSGWLQLADPEESAKYILMLHTWGLGEM